MDIPKTGFKQVTGRRLAPAAAAFLILANCAFIGGAQARMMEGNRKFQAGDYRKAKEFYADLAVNHPKSPYILNNLGLAQCKLDEWEEAVGSFQKSLDRNAGRDKRLEGAARYNQGVCYARQALDQGQELTADDRRALLDKSLQCLKGAMKADPGDMDAKYDYELLKRLIESDNDQDMNGQDRQKSGNQQEKKDQSQQGNQGQGNQDKQDEQKDRERGENGRQQSPQETGQTPPGALTPEQAAEILKQAQNMEKYALMAPAAEAPVAKDW